MPRSLGQCQGSARVEEAHNAASAARGNQGAVVGSVCRVCVRERERDGEERERDEKGERGGREVERESGR